MIIKNSTPWLRTDAIERMNDDCSKHAILDEDSSVKSPTSITNWNMETASVLNSRVAPPWWERRHWKHVARNQREMRVELNVVNWVACLFVCCYFICKTVFEFVLCCMRCIGLHKSYESLSGWTYSGDPRWMFWHFLLWTEWKSNNAAGTVIYW